jgi:hypothetical protein
LAISSTLEICRKTDLAVVENVHDLPETVSIYDR